MWFYTCFNFKELLFLQENDGRKRRDTVSSREMMVCTAS